MDQVNKGNMVEKSPAGLNGLNAPARLELDDGKHREHWSSQLIELASTNTPNTDRIVAWLLGCLNLHDFEEDFIISCDFQKIYQQYYDGIRVHGLSKRPYHAVLADVINDWRQEMTNSETSEVTAIQKIWCHFKLPGLRRERGLLGVFTVLILLRWLSRDAIEPGDDISSNHSAEKMIQRIKLKTLEIPIFSPGEKIRNEYKLARANAIVDKEPTAEEVADAMDCVESRSCGIVWHQNESQQADFPQHPTRATTCFSFLQEMDWTELFRHLGIQLSLHRIGQTITSVTFYQSEPSTSSPSDELVKWEIMGQPSFDDMISKIRDGSTFKVETETLERARLESLESGGSTSSPDENSQDPTEWWSSATSPATAAMGQDPTLGSGGSNVARRPLHWNLEADRRQRIMASQERRAAKTQNSGQGDEPKLSAGLWDLRCSH